MAKRGALSEMNHDNWDQEEETEEAGVFKQAADNVIKKREIKRAKRRGVAGQSDGSDGAPAAPAFKGFSGFVASNTKPTFSFNKDTNKPLSGLSNGGGAPFSLGGGSLFGAAKPTAQIDSQPEKKQETTVNGNTQSKSKYLQQLKSLNESVSKWITEHVNKNAYCVLTPIFKDYEKHLAEVEKLNPDSKTPAGTAAAPAAASGRETTAEDKSSPVKSTAASAVPTFSFTSGGSSAAGENKNLFGASTKSQTTTAPLFGGTALTSSKPAFGSGFTFKPSDSVGGELKPFSFASGTSAAPAQSQQETEEEDYEPPKVEVHEIKEDDAFYTKKCKLYYQKSGAWTERGVGHIHLKPCGEKTQFLVRADTNLGNILLNIMLSSSIPLARQGKNNVSMLCMSNPPIDPKEKDPKPTSFLIRVKSGEEADELLEKLKEHQK